MTIPVKRGELRAKVESTYGVDPTIAASDAVYVETFTVAISDNFKPREGLSPYAPGHKGYPTFRSSTFSGMCFFPTLTLTTGSEAAIEIDPILRMVGFGAAVDATPAGSKTRKYSLLAQGQGSASLALYEYDAANTAAVLKTLRGCRAQGTIKLSGEGAVELSFAGEASSATEVNSGSGPVALAFENQPPTVGGAGTVTLTELGSSTVFGGLLFNAEFGLYPMTPSQGLAARVINIRPGGTAVSVKLTMEQQIRSAFDVQAYIAANTALSLHIALPVAVTGGDSLEFDTTFQMVSATSDEGPEGNMVWTIEGLVIFPEVSSDGGGVVPVSDVFSATYRTTD